MSLQSISSGGAMVNLTSANFATASFSTVAPAGVSFSSATGILNQRISAGTQPGCALTCTGLPLAVYRVRMTNNVASGMNINGFEIITPVHSAKSSTPNDPQNTLPVGSCAVLDTRQTSMIKEPRLKNKNIVQAFGTINVLSNPTTSSTVPVPLQDMSVTHSNATGRIKVSYSCVGQNSLANNQVRFGVWVNGVAVWAPQKVGTGAASAPFTVADSFVIDVPVGTNKVDIFWQVTGGTGTAFEKNLTVEEV